MYKAVLLISDLHLPYEHQDSFKFLRALKKKYAPDKVASVGDEVDGHSISFHDKSPELLSPKDELEDAIKKMKTLYDIFPEMDIVESNHGSLVYRKARYAGLPARVIKSYNDILEAPKEYKWHSELIIPLSDGTDVYICHGKTSDSTRLSKSMGMHSVQGHFHEKFKVEYYSTPVGLFWGATIGCLIDDESLAYSYNKLNVHRPVIGCAIILHGHIKLLPMVLDSNKRWNGHVP